MELAANFTLNNESLDAQFDISELENFDAIFELYAAGTTWGNISGTLSNQTDLQTALDLKANQSELDTTNNTVSNLADTVTDNYNTLNNKIGANTQSITTINGTLATFGDIVTYDADDFATAAQGALADTALQPSDNISELTNNVGYITSSALSGYATESYVNDGLATKQDTLSAGANIQIVNNTISATDTTYSAGQGISIVNGTISNTQTSAEWGNITGTLSDQTDLQNALNAKYDASNPDGFITGIDSTDVTTALGYTPYDASNPDGYTSNVGTVTSVNNVSPDANGNVTITIPSAATWGSITGTLSDQTDLQNALNDKQNTLTAGSNITISNGTISATDTIYTLPSATTSTLGGIIVGNNLSIAADGTLSSTDTTYSQGDGIVISGGSISVSTTIASKTDIGTADITIKENGTAIGTINANATTASYIDISVPTTATEVGALPSSTIIGDGAVIFQKNGTALGTITANQTSTTTVNYTIPTTASDVGALPDTTTIGDGATTIQVNGTSVGTITANQTTSGSINISALQNNSTDMNGLSILGYPSSESHATSIGVGSQVSYFSTSLGARAASSYSAIAVGESARAAGSYSVCMGNSANALADYSNAIGYQAEVSNSSSSAIQLGYGTNSTAKSFSVGFYDNSTPTNYQLLDGTTGLIPYQRINSLTETRNSGRLKFWTGTKAQYDAIVTKDANTLYNITDDTDVTLTLLNALYPIGSIYIGTMANCPLATLGIGTWQLVATGLLKYSNNVPVKGSGLSLGLTNGTGDFSFSRLGSSSANAYTAIYASETFNQPVGTSVGGSGYSIGASAIGVTTDGTKSGMLTDLSSLEISTNVWERVS
jgi:hypothetical protein